MIIRDLRRCTMSMRARKAIPHFGRRIVGDCILISSLSAPRRCRRRDAKVSRVIIDGLRETVHKRCLILIARKREVLAIPERKSI